MIKLVAERGYEGVKLRAISRLSGVSSRAFYIHYASKEECFLQTHELIVRRIIRRILAAQVQTPTWDDQLRITIRVFLKQIARDPRAARLILVDAYTAGPAAREQLRRADHTFEARFKSCFDREPADAEMPPILIKAIVAGILSIARSRVVNDRTAELPDLAEDLSCWALELRASAHDLVGEPNRHHPRGEFALRPLAPAGDRALLLTAVAKLAATQGYENLTVRDIRDAAGSSPRRFEASFNGVEECFLAAFEEKVKEALAEAAAARAAANSWEEGIRSAAATICARIAADPLFARICFEKVQVVGPRGVRSRLEAIDEAASCYRATLPSGSDASELAAEIAIGTSWELIDQHVADGQLGQVIRLAPVLAGLLTMLA